MVTKFDPLVICLNLRCKEMSYQVDSDRVDSDRDPDDAGKGAGEAFDTAMYWCECTQTGRGPDDRPVNKKDCSCPERGCFEGIQNLA